MRNDRALALALAALLLTSVHHVYGAYVFHTPWRLHAAFIAAVAAAVLVPAHLVLRRRTSAIAFAVFAAVIVVVSFAGIGLFEGAYNHVLKNILYFGGASKATMNALFPPPTYELPSDVFFEVTGVLQTVPALLSGVALVRRRRR